MSLSTAEKLAVDAKWYSIFVDANWCSSFRDTKWYSVCGWKRHRSAPGHCPAISRARKYQLLASPSRLDTRYMWGRPQRDKKHDTKDRENVTVRIRKTSSWRKMILVLLLRQIDVRFLLMQNDIHSAAQYKRSGKSHRPWPENEQLMQNDTHFLLMQIDVRLLFTIAKWYSVRSWKRHRSAPRTLSGYFSGSKISVTCRL